MAWRREEEEEVYSQPGLLLNVGAVYYLVF